MGFISSQWLTNMNLLNLYCKDQMCNQSNFYLGKTIIISSERLNFSYQFQRMTNFLKKRKKNQKIKKKSKSNSSTLFLSFHFEFIIYEIVISFIRLDRRFLQDNFSFNLSDWLSQNSTCLYSGVELGRCYRDSCPR